MEAAQFDSATGGVNVAKRPTVYEMNDLQHVTGSNVMPASGMIDCTPSIPCGVSRGLSVSPASICDAPFLESAGWWALQLPGNAVMVISEVCGLGDCGCAVPDALQNLCARGPFEQIC